MEQGPMQRNSILCYLNAKIRILQYFVNETFVVMTRFLSGTAYCRNPSVFQLTKDYTCAYCERQLKPVSTRNFNTVVCQNIHSTLIVILCLTTYCRTAAYRVFTSLTITTTRLFQQFICTDCDGTWSPMKVKQCWVITSSQLNTCLLSSCCSLDTLLQ